MKKIFFIFSLFVLLPILSGCSSNIIAKYDDYNETFRGKSYYDPVIGRATIKVESDKSKAICTGNAFLFQYPIWQFKLTCSDGRAIQGTLTSATVEGKAFTNRNELITFSVAKKQSTINNAAKRYNSEIQNKPKIDNLKEHIQVIMQN